MLHFDVKEGKQVAFTELHKQMVAAAKAVQVAHEIDPDIKVGIMVAGFCIYPYSCNPDDVLAAYKKFQNTFGYCADTVRRGYYPSYATRIWADNGVTLEITEADKEDLRKGKADFLAYSYYMSSVTKADDEEGISGAGGQGSIKNPYLEASHSGWQIDPVGYEYFLQFIYDRYQVPIFDVENGLGAFDKVNEDGHVHDDYRIDYHRTHIQSLMNARDQEVDIFGYTTWDPIDLVSFMAGQMDKRYGMVYVNINDKGEGGVRQIRKDSFYLYKKVIASDGRDLD